MVKNNNLKIFLVLITAICLIACILSLIAIIKIDSVSKKVESLDSKIVEIHKFFGIGESNSDYYADDENYEELEQTNYEEIDAEEELKE